MGVLLISYGYDGRTKGVSIREKEQLTELDYEWYSIKYLKRFEELLDINPLSDEELISTFPTPLYVLEDDIGAVDLSVLSHIQDYLVLSIECISNEIDLRGLLTCRILQGFRLTGYNIEEVDLAPFDSLDLLRHVVINYTKTTELDCTPLQNLRELHLLNLQSNRINNLVFDNYEDSMHSLYPKWTQLTDLDLSYNELEHLDLHHFRESKQLESLSLKGNRLGGVDLTPLSGFSNLRAVDLSSNQLTEVDLYPLEDSPLKGLDLSYNKLYKLNLFPLWKKSTLQGLNLQMNQLQNLDLRPLTDSKNLEALIISQNQITELDITPLIASLKLDWYDFDDFTSFLVREDTLQESKSKLPSLFRYLVRLRKLKIIAMKESGAAPVTNQTLDEIRKELADISKSMQSLHQNTLEIMKASGESQENQQEMIIFLERLEKQVDKNGEFAKVLIMNMELIYNSLIDGNRSLEESLHMLQNRIDDIGKKLGMDRDLLDRIQDAITESMAKKVQTTIFTRIKEQMTRPEIAAILLTTIRRVLNLLGLPIP